ncbi:sugar ABC transporter permease [Candidatus Aerophobetes bacterium]|nr:sugar ABC transporter permease [Candidatus Aerophobetes bacterium]
MLKAMYPYFLIAPALAFVMLILAYPVVSGFIGSLYTYDMFTLESEFAGLNNYLRLFTNPRFQNSLLRSVILAGGTIGLGLFLSLSFALCLNSIRIFKAFFRGVSLVPWLVSGIAAAVMFRFLFSGNGGLIYVLYESLGFQAVSWLGHSGRAMLVLILTNTWFLCPFAILVMFAGLQTIDPNYYDAAAIDGCYGLRTLWHVTVPLIKPMIGISLIWLSFASFSIFDIVLPTTGGGPGRATEVMAVAMYRVAFHALDYATGYAIMTVILVINIAMSFVYLKLFRV